jgi:hypothetical protein
MNYYTVRAAAPTYDVLFPLVDSWTSRASIQQQWVDGEDDNK